MSTRESKMLQKLVDLRNHSWMKRFFKGISPSDIRIMTLFILENSELQKQDFEFKVNRLFLDKEKPKRWTQICDILLAAGSIE